MLEFVGDLAELEDPEDFRAALLPGLRELVPCELASYNEVDIEIEWVVTALDPPEAMPPDGAEIFVRFGHQNPLLARYQRTRDGRPYKWSDLITRRELHRTELYSQLYGPMGVEYQIAFCLPTPPEVVIAFALNRGRRDFSESERRLLELVRAPLIRAYRTVERYGELVKRLEAIERGLERTGLGVVTLERSEAGYEPGLVSEEAGRALGLDGTGDAQELPLRVRAWLELDQGAHERPPLVLEGPGQVRSVIRLLPARREGEVDALLVEPVGEMVSTRTLQAAGLTPREAQVVRLLALGHSNGLIATELGVSPRTVQKHLQRIYEKLGTTSRTQTVLTAWSIARGSR